MLVKTRGIAVVLLATLTGCAGPGVKRAQLDGEQEQCLAFYREADAIVAEAGVGDAEASRVRGFPYLRTDRFGASLGEDDMDPAQFDAWVDRMVSLDRDARAVEYQNLVDEYRQQLASDATSFSQRTAACAAALRRHDGSEPPVYGSLSRRAQVPPSYSNVQRAFGLYPITSAFMSGGVSRLHRKLRQDFEQPLESLPVKGELVRYGPSDTGGVLERAEVAALLERSATNALRIPEPAGRDGRRLLESFAPIWEVDVASRDDRIGSPEWLDGKLSVAVDRPVVYGRFSHTRFGGETLLQLNYMVWFPARTPSRPIDLLAGELDGIIWRVTLASDGTPLVFDTIHNCGCYHMFFPSEQVERIPGADADEEPLFVPQQLRAAPGARAVIRVAAGSHYVQRVYFDQKDVDVSYMLQDYHELRSLASADGRRSLFAPDGLVPASKRGERWFLWPSGVRSPGAMRQWGHHAVVFLGKRHFDDPDLMARYFHLTEAAKPPAESGQP